MSGLSNLPIASGVSDSLRLGLSPAESAAAPLSSSSLVHPVQQIERTFVLQQDANQKALLARVYGSHLPMKLHMEQTILSQFRRAPGLGVPSSNLGLSIVMGQDEDIDWGDVMNRPENDERQFEPTSEMENRFLGTQKRRVF